MNGQIRAASDVQSDISHHRLTVVAMGDRVSVCLRREGFQTQTNQCEFLIALRKVPPSPEHLYQYTRRGLHLYSVIG